MGVETSVWARSLICLLAGLECLCKLYIPLSLKSHFSVGALLFPITLVYILYELMSP